MKIKLAKLYYTDNGFTLIEVMLSIVIFSILALGMLTFFSQAMSYTQTSKNDTLGIYAARNVMNFMEHQDFSEIKTEYVDHLNINGNKSSVTLTEQVCNELLLSTEEVEVCKATFHPVLNNDSVNVTVEIKKHSDKSLQDSLIPITVQVKWGENKESSLEGFIANEKLR